MSIFYNAVAFRRGQFTEADRQRVLAAYESDREKYFSKLADIPVTDVLTGPDDVDVDSDSDDGAASQDNKKNRQRPQVEGRQPETYKSRILGIAELFEAYTVYISSAVQ